MVLLYAYVPLKIKDPEASCKCLGGLLFQTSADCGSGKCSSVIGIASENEGVYVDRDKISLTGELDMISITISCSPLERWLIPLNGKLRGPKSAFWMRIE